MLQPGDLFVHPSGVEVRIQAWGEGPAGVGEWLASVPPGSGFLPEHAHPQQVESFRIERGGARYDLGGVAGRLGAGEELVVPAGVRHINPWNDGAEPLVFTQRFTPILDFEEILARLGFRPR